MSPQLVADLTQPLIGGHPVVSGEAMRALSRADLCELGLARLQSLSRELIPWMTKPMAGNWMQLVLALAKANPDSVSKLATLLLEMWRSTKSGLAIQFYSLTEVPIAPEDLTGMASEVLRSIRTRNEQVSSTTPMGFGGHSLWSLLASLIERSATVDPDDLLRVSVHALLNPHHTSAFKRECLESLLWLFTSGRLAGTGISEKVVGAVRDEMDRVLRARGFGSILSASRDELTLFYLALLAVDHKCSAEHLLARVAMASRHELLDTRLAAVAVLRMARAILTDYDLDRAVPTLVSMTRDANHEVRHFASHGLSEILLKARSGASPELDVLLELASDKHWLVRAGLVHVTSKWLHVGQARGTNEMLRSDPDYRVRRQFELLLEAETTVANGK